MLNKAQFFNNNLAKNPVSTAKVFPILVDFAEKMEKLLDDMRSFFDGLALEISLAVPLEHIPDISGDIPSQIKWGKEFAPTKTPTKPDQPGPSEQTKEVEEIPPQAKYESLPRRVAEPVTTRREIPIGEAVEHIIEELKEVNTQPSRS